MANKYKFTLDEVLQGKATRIKNKTYFKTADYINPFLDRMSKFTNDFRVEVKPPEQLTINDDGKVTTDDLTFNRVWIQAVLPDEICDEHTRTIGMVMGLDVRKPICKFYSGGLNMACTNLCVFQPSAINVQEIEPEKAIDYTPIKYLMERTDNIRAKIEMMQNTQFLCTEQNINESLGRWVRNAMYMDYNSQYGKVKFSPTGVINAYKLLFDDEESNYYVGHMEETDMYNIYGALTKVITDDDKDIMNHADKTLLVGSILGII